MLDELRVEGFKSFGPGSHSFPLAPITVLLGENSVGKSSVFQILLGLSQTWDRFDAINRFSPVGRDVDLGRFGTLLHRRGNFSASALQLSVSDRLSAGLDRQFSFRWNLPVAQQVEGLDPPDPVPYGWPESWTVQDTAHFGILSKLKVTYEGVDYEFLASEEEDGRLTVTLAVETTVTWFAGPERADQRFQTILRDNVFLRWRIDVSADTPLMPFVEQKADCESPNPDLQANLAELVQSEPFGEGTLWAHATHALGQLKSFRRTISSVSHICGIRHRGQRLYEPHIADNPWKVGPTGQRMVDVLLNTKCEERTNELLEACGIDYRLSLTDPKTTANVYELLLEDLRPGIDSGLASLPDIGTGIAQILPIAVQIAALSDRTRFNSIDPILLVEQPELHLHPRLQAQLARLFAAALQADSKSTDSRAVQIIAETHSEHLVLGLGCLVKEKLLAPEDVCLLKMHRNSVTHEVLVDRVPFTKDGRFDEDWPEGFFEERFALEEGRLE